MSKQSEAKAAQGYDPKPEPSTCGNCGHFQCDMTLPTWMARENEVLSVSNKWGPEHKRETNLRCGLGGFAVKKSATCKKFINPVAA
jgi:hypothetical protein